MPFTERSKPPVDAVCGHTCNDRSYNGRLLALRPVREAEVDAAISTDTSAAAAGNTSSDSDSLLREGVFGASRPDLDGISSAPYETHHVGSYNDYVVTVQVGNFV